jgi:hypothetical protein
LMRPGMAGAEVRVEMTTDDPPSGGAGVLCLQPLCGEPLSSVDWML